MGISTRNPPRLADMIPIKTEALFAVPLGVTTISPEICDVLKTLQGGEQRGRRSNAVLQSAFNVLDGYPKIKSDLTDIFSFWINSLLGTTKQKWAMTTNWITLNPNGDDMTVHRHFNCMYSGVLYFDKVDENHPPLELINPFFEVFGGFLIPSPEDKINVFNATSTTAPIKEGQMIFFPSYLVHGHPAFKRTGIVRKSFACNFFPTGKFGRYDSTIDTQWIQ